MNLLIIFFFGFSWNALYDSLSFIVSHFNEVEKICIDIQLPCLSKPQETDFLTEYCKVTFDYNINIKKLMFYVTIPRDIY